MQERKTLAYISSSGIPASAKEITSSNVSTINGNVIYFPISFPNSSSVGTTSLFLFLSTDESKIKFISLNEIQFTQSGTYYLLTSGTTFSIYSGYLQSTSLYFPRIKSIPYYSSGSGNSTTDLYLSGGMSPSNASLTTSVWIANRDFGYCKIKLGVSVKPYSSFTSVASFPYIGPIYLDTEN